MVSSSLFLGINIGQDRLELVLTGERGQVEAKLQRGFGSGRNVEQDPQDWWRATRTGIKELLRRSQIANTRIIGLGLCGPSHAAVCLGGEGEILAPAIPGDDDRFEGYDDLLVSKVGLRTLFNITGNRPHRASFAAKLMWLRDHEKRVWHDLAHILQPRDFLRQRFTGSCVTDPSTAAKTLLYNVRSNQWSKQLLTNLEFDPAWLPTVNPGHLLSGRITQTAARETGLQAGTPVITGGNHVSTPAVAVGAVYPGQATIELGNEGSLFVPLDKPLKDKTHRLFASCHCIPDVWTLEAQHVISDRSIKWLQEQVTIQELQQSKRSKRPPLDVLAELAAETRPGADGLLFLQPDHHGGGGFIGLEHEHGHGHMVRAVLEAGALDLRSLVDHLRSLEAEPDSYRITGPGAENQLWCQIISDCLGAPVTCLPIDEPTAVGAALMATVMTGSNANVRAAAEAHTLKGRTLKPRKSAMATYDEVAARREALSDTIHSSTAPNSPAHNPRS
jgi:xylulokinase